MSELKKKMYPHLSSAALEYVDSSTDDRIRYIRSPRWIGYTRAKEILSKLEDLQAYP
ncbi:AAA family ATPase, partial [Vibrio anguillarum]|nr:AAA family ATPase [Vibrio anguillarum]